MVWHSSRFGARSETVLAQFTQKSVFLPVKRENDGNQKFWRIWQNAEKWLQRVSPEIFHFLGSEKIIFTSGSICTFSIHLIVDSAKVWKRSLPDGPTIQNIKTFILPWETLPKSKVSSLQLNIALRLSPNECFQTGAC